jgi:hypothetical protein
MGSPKCSLIHLSNVYETTYLTSWDNLLNVRGTTYLTSRVDTKWCFQFFAKNDYRFLLDVIIVIIATFFAKSTIAISRLSLSISLE